MIIDNGRKVRLIIEGVFDGMAGMSAGKVAFVPNQFARTPESAVGGTLDGSAVRLAIAREGNGPAYFSRVFDL